MGRPVTRWQILSRDPDATASFYGELFDWQVDADNPLGARMVRTGGEGGIEGGIWPAPPEAPSFVQLFVDVPDVEDAVSRAEGLGARVLVPPSTLPDGERMAVLHDPQGLPFVVHQRAAGDG